MVNPSTKLGRETMSFGTSWSGKVSPSKDPKEAGSLRVGSTGEAVHVPAAEPPFTVSHCLTVMGTRQTSVSQLLSLAESPVSPAGEAWEVEKETGKKDYLQDMNPEAPRTPSKPS